MGAGGNQAHETGKPHKRDPRETGKYELLANIGKKRTMPRQGIAGTGDREARWRGLDMGRDREGAHGGTGRLVRGEKAKGFENYTGKKIIN